MRRIRTLALILLAAPACDIPEQVVDDLTASIEPADPTDNEPEPVGTAICDGEVEVCDFSVGCYVEWAAVNHPDECMRGCFEHVELPCLIEEAAEGCGWEPFTCKLESQPCKIDCGGASE